MSDFREFSEVYNDYLMHRHSAGYNAKRTAKEWNMIKRHAENIKGLDINYLKYRITEADYDKAVDYYMRGENALGDEILSKYAGVVYHNDFRDYSDYLEHAYGPARGIDKGELLRQIAIAIKAARKGVPADKQQQYDQATNQLNQAISENDRQQAIQAISIIERYGTPGGRSRFLNDIVDSIFKKEEIRVNTNARDFRQGRPRRI